MDSEPMDISGTIISPSTDKKIRSRNAALRLKHGVPQFKDVLRKRFLSRIKESRGRIFDRLRDINQSQKDDICQVIHQELTSIINKNEIYDTDEEDCIKIEMEHQALAEQENWLMQQYDLLMTDDSTLQQLWEESQQVICPVCKKGNLMCTLFAQEIRCNHCSLAVPARASMLQIQDQIYAIVGNHSDTGCQDEVLFFVSEEDSSLYAHCRSCPFLDLIV